MSLDNQPVWVRALLDKSLSPTDKNVFSYLSWRQGSNGDSWPSQGVIAADLQLTERTVRSSTKRLEEREYLCIHRPKDQGRGRSLRYSIINHQKGGNKCTPLSKKGGNKRHPLAPERRKSTTSKGGTQSPTNTIQYRKNTNKKSHLFHQIFDHWNSYKGQSVTKDGKKITWHSHRLRPDGELPADIKKAITNTLTEGHTVDEIKAAITNYSKVLFGKDFYWTYVWPLPFFLSRGEEKHKGALRKWFRFKDDNFVEQNYLTEAAKTRRANANRGPSVYKMIRDSNQRAEVNNAEIA